MPARLGGRSQISSKILSILLPSGKDSVRIMPEVVPHHAVRRDRSDGSILLTSGIGLGDCVPNTGSWLHRWEKAAPDRVFIAERSGAGWRSVSYAAAAQMVRAVAEALIGRGLTGKSPILIMSGNGIDHAILALAAQYVGIPSVPLAEQYSLVPEAHQRLVDAIAMVKPKLAYVADASAYGKAIELEALAGIEIVATQPLGAPRRVTGFSDLLRGDASVDLAPIRTAVGPDTLAKIIMTSGSSSLPKGVQTTHRMLCVNQAQLSAVMPFLAARPPVLVDWLPWNHTFGGSHNFNLILANGGSLYIDDGKPTKADFGRMVENLRLVTGTLALNVPVGFSMLLEELRQDRELKRRFFADLDLLFYAGASLPATVWNGLKHMAQEICGAPPLMISSWGMTETAPASIQVHEHIGEPGAIGVPLPEVQAKLVPLEDNRFELRVAGPNVMLGYFNDPQKTAESFDEEGFLITGDAVRFRDQRNLNAGLIFDGRTSEDFKLLTGTWVRATILRAQVLAHLQGLAQDIVIAGQDRHEIGLLIFPHPDLMSGNTDEPVLHTPSMAEDVSRRLSQAGTSSGTSMRIARAILMTEPPSVKDAEITAKGSLNPRRVLSRRSALVERLYNDDDPAVIRI